MSSTNRGAIRADADFYPTPPPPVRLFLSWVDRGLVPRPRLIVDPCAGNGSLIRTVREHGYQVGAMELQPDFRPELDAVVPGGAVYGDALGSAAGEALRRAVERTEDVAVLTNPPFSKAREFIDAWAPVVTWSAWLLRLNFYAGKKKHRWLTVDRRPSHVLSLAERVAFVAVCKGVTKAKDREARKGCGLAYALGTRGKCECGGTIADGTDSIEYAFLVFRGRGQVPSSTLLDMLCVE